MFDRRAVILKYPGRQEINKMISKNKSKTKLYMHRPLGDALFFCFLKYVFTGFLASSLIAVTLFQWQLDMTAKVAPYWSGSSVYTKGRKSKIVVSEQAVFLLPSPTPSPPVFSSSQSFLLNSFNMAPEIELASCKFPPSHKTHSYAVYQPVSPKIDYETGMAIQSCPSLLDHFDHRKSVTISAAGHSLRQLAATIMPCLFARY